MAKKAGAGNQLEQKGDDSPAISARGLVKQFEDVAVVEDVSFDVPRGSIFGFIGPSGAGKTTTIRLLTGVYAPTSGEVEVLGRNPAKFSQRERARIGYMPQHFVLYPNLTVWENMNFAASLYGMGLFRGLQMKKVLEFVGLEADHRKLARNISGGMQRRLSLAATLVHNPQLMFLDEPTAGIDPVLRRKFWDHFQELKDEGRTIFLTTQYVTEADYCDLVGVQNNGRLIVVATPRELRHRAFGGDLIDFHTDQPIDARTEAALLALPFVLSRSSRTGPDNMRIVVDEAKTTMPELILWAQGQKLGVKSMEEHLPSFEDVFVRLVRPEESDV